MKKTLIGLVVVIAGCSSEPAFQGRSLGSWMAQLSDKDPTARQEAIRALGQIGPEAVPPLCEALASGNTNVRMAAAEVTQNIGGCGTAFSVASTV